MIGSEDYEIRMFKVPKTLPHGNITTYNVEQDLGMTPLVINKSNDLKTDGDLRKDEALDLSNARVSDSVYDIKAEADDIISRFRHCIGKNLLFITVTLPPKFYKFQSITQYDLTITDLFKILNVYSDKYVGSIELTEVGNVHYHVMVLVGNSQDKIHLINALKKKRTFGFIKTSPDVQTPDSLNKTASYICKSLNDTAKIFWHKPGYRPDIIFHDDKYYWV